MRQNRLIRKCVVCGSTFKLSNSDPEITRYGKRVWCSVEHRRIHLQKTNPDLQRVSNARYGHACCEEPDVRIADGINKCWSCNTPAENEEKAALRLRMWKYQKGAK